MATALKDGYDIPIERVIAVSRAVKNKSALERVLYTKAGKANVKSGRANVLESRLREAGADISHWTGRRVRKKTEKKPKKPLVDLKAQSLKRRILEEGLIKEVCAECEGPPVWRDKPLTLHLDHINGDSSDHRFKNLRFLCPNCHQQTETWGNKRSRKLPEDDDVLRELALTHLYAEIAEIYGVHPSSVSHRLRKYNEP
jgi:5-methylcytosine-specific restriction endonuclease McrA